MNIETMFKEITDMDQYWTIGRTVELGNYNFYIARKIQIDSMFYFTNTFYGYTLEDAVRKCWLWMFSQNIKRGICEIHYRE